MSHYLAIGIGGSLGAMARFLLGQLVARQSSSNFPLATWVINISGSFLLGVYMGLQSHLLLNPQAEAMLILGFLSSYTTFSTFTYESLSLIQKGNYSQAATYMLSSLALGILAAFLGVYLGSLPLL